MTTTATPDPSVTRLDSAIGGVSARLVHPAEAAQAAHFQSLRQVELSHLESLLKRLPAGWAEEGVGRPHPSAAVMQLSGRLREIRRLLKGLRDRFPHDLSG